jgi:hypothetical protein
MGDLEKDRGDGVHPWHVLEVLEVQEWQADNGPERRRER